MSVAPEWTPRGKVEDGTHFLVTGNQDLTTAKKVVCCVNGIGSHFIFYDKLAKTLVDDGYSVIQYDLIGRGHSSPAPNGKFGADEHVDQLHHLLTKTLGLEKPIHIVAHSMGGALATVYVSRHPDNIKSLVLMAPAGQLPPGLLPYLRAFSPFSYLASKVVEPIDKQERSWRRDFVNHTGIFKQREDEMVREMHKNSGNARAFKSIWASIMQFPLYGLDKEIARVSQIEGLPTLLMWGKQDRPVPFSPCYDRWMSILSRGRLKLTTKVLDNAGHAFMLEHPEETNETILKFLRSVE